MTNQSHPGTLSVPMTRRETRRRAELAEMGYSTREIDEQFEHESKAPSGSYFANALAFIVEALADKNVNNTDDIENLGNENLHEWALQYNFTMDALEKALEYFRQAVTTEVMNAHWNGECNNCTENPAQFN